MHTDNYKLELRNSTFRLAWCRERSAVAATEFFAAAGPRLWNSLPVQLATA